MFDYRDVGSFREGWQLGNSRGVRALTEGCETSHHSHHHRHGVRIVPEALPETMPKRRQSTPVTSLLKWPVLAMHMHALRSYNLMHVSTYVLHVIRVVEFYKTHEHF